MFFLIHFLFLLDFFLDNFTLFHELFLLICNDSLLLDVELRPFVLEDFFADFLMFTNAVWVKLSSTTLPAHDKSRWVILLDLNFL